MRTPQCLLVAALCLATFAPIASGQLYVTEGGGATLYQIDPLTAGTVTSVPLTMAGFTISGANALATDPTTLTMYIALNTGSAIGRDLATVDPLTGICTSIGPLGDQVSGFAFDGNGTLYAVTGDGGFTTTETLFAVDLTTGVMTLLSPLGYGADGEAIAFNCDDNLIYHYSGYTTPLAETVDPATLTTTVIPGVTTPSTSEIQGAVWEGPGTNSFLTNSFGVLGRIDTLGNYTVLGTMLNTTGGTQWGGGIAFAGASVPTCLPPPATCALTLTGTINPDTTYSIAVNNIACTPLAQYFTCITINAGVAPNGFFAGISPLLTELTIQLNTPAPPFNGVLDATGASSFNALLPFGPLGVVLDAVTVEHVGGLVTLSTPPVTTGL